MSDFNFDVNNPEWGDKDNWSPSGRWKAGLLKHIGHKNNIQVLIETGTCLGTTVGACASVFPRIYTVELSSHYYRLAKDRLENLPSIKLYHGSSKDKLEQMIKDAGIQNRKVFWLDAHYSGGATADDGDCLSVELEIIDRLARNSIVVIDDISPLHISPFGPVKEMPGWNQKFHNGVLIMTYGEQEVL